MPTKEIAPGVLAVTELPEDAKNFTVIESHWYFPSLRIEHSIGGVDLPPGSWSIVGWSDELTYEQKGFICKRENGYFEDYCGDGYLFTSVTLSYVSFLTFHGIRPEDYLLIENKK
jgi:hypothetical protein